MCVYRHSCRDAYTNNCIPLYIYTHANTHIFIDKTDPSDPIRRVNSGELRLRP